MYSPWRPCLPLGNPALESFLHLRGALERGSSAISLTPGRCPRLALREVSTEQVSVDKKLRFGAGGPATGGVTALGKCPTVRTAGTQGQAEGVGGHS